MLPCKFIISMNLQASIQQIKFKYIYFRLFRPNRKRGFLKISLIYYLKVFIDNNVKLFVAIMYRKPQRDWLSGRTLKLDRGKMGFINERILFVLLIVDFRI